ncbi:MAG: arsenate reductase ArsC [Crenarchaeota archaeon]|nr:arsenate reductase ArsC [Thermoproteota archaeon]MDW8033609.1 arsenate reductase ArsC [Nitrososphaerota archaeon]
MVRKVLFVCVQNSFRSQVAEAFFNQNPPEGWIAISAGPKPADKVNPVAIQLMAERGIDISGKKPKKLSKEMEAEAEIAVIVCSGSECPVVSVKYVENWGIEDPAEMSLEDARRIVDEIEVRVRDLAERIGRGDVPTEKPVLRLDGF